MRSTGETISRYLFIVSLYGLALFIPFSIAGANVSIMLGFLATLIAVVAGGRSARERYRDIHRDPLFVASIALVVLALPSVFMSEDLRRALRDWKSYWLLLVYFLVAYNVASDRIRRTAFWILFASMGLSCLVAMVQFRGGLDLVLFHIPEQTYRPSSTLFTMTFAGILYQLTTLNFAVVLGERRLNRRAIVLAVGIALQVTALLFTLTRGAWLALAAGLVAVIVLLKRRKVALFAAVVVAAAVVLVVQSDTLRDRARTMVDNIGSPTDKNISTRLVLWDISWKLIKQNPLVGVGMGDYSIEAEKLLEERKVTTLVDSHNIYLQMLATRGLLGFVPFVFFWIALFRMLAKVLVQVRDDDGFARYFVTGAIAVCIAVLVGAVSENNTDDSEVFTAFLFVLGLARSFAITSPQPDATSQPQISQ